MSELALKEIRRLSRELSATELSLAWDILRQHSHRLSQVALCELSIGDKVKVNIKKHGVGTRTGIVTGINRTTVSVRLDKMYDYEREFELLWRLDPSLVTKAEA